MVKLKQDFEIWANTDNLLRFIITASDGVTGQTLTGSAMRWILQDEVNSSCWLYSASLGAMIAISGSQVDVTIEASRITGLNGWYYHELKLLTTGSVAVLATGTGKVNKSSGG